MCYIRAVPSEKHQFGHLISTKLTKTGEWQTSCARVANVGTVVAAWDVKVQDDWSSNLSVFVCRIFEDPFSKLSFLMFMFDVILVHSNEFVVHVT